MLLAEKLSTAKERYGQADRPARVPAPGVDACYSVGLIQKQVRIKNISPTGVYLISADRWPIGSTVQLTLKSRTAPDDPRIQVNIPATVIRRGADGVGMEFLLNVGTAAWLMLFSKAVSMTPNDEPIPVFRAAKALAFLARVTCLAENQVSELLAKSMDPERTERAIGIILMAETVLESRKLTPGTNVSSVLIRQILAGGSKNGDELAQRYWAGMLAAAALDRPEYSTTAAFATLLSQLAPVHFHILDAAGSRAVLAERKSGLARETSFYSSIEDIKKITGSEDLAEIETALDHLDALGLMELTVKVFGFVRANLTPTRLGLYLHLLCSGEPDLFDATEPAKVRKGFRPTRPECGEEHKLYVMGDLSRRNSANMLKLQTMESGKAATGTVSTIGLDSDPNEKAKMNGASEEASHTTFGPAHSGRS
jgi:hypothetical protein